MKVILLKEIKDLGPADTVQNVSDGYARNFLFPKNLAVPAEKPAMKALEIRQKSRSEEIEKEKASLREIASKLDGKQITINVDAGEGGKLFGSVTSHDISQKIYEAFGVEVDKKKIHLEEPIKSTGLFKVPVKFLSDITASIQLNVAPNTKA
jgi:large subunit ribosomal protein L9